MKYLKQYLVTRTEQKAVVRKHPVTRYRIDSQVSQGREPDKLPLALHFPEIINNWIIMQKNTQEFKSGDLEYEVSFQGSMR